VGKKKIEKNRTRTPEKEARRRKDPKLRTLLQSATRDLQGSSRPSSISASEGHDHDGHPGEGVDPSFFGRGWTSNAAHLRCSTVNNASSCSTRLNFYRGRRGLQEIEALCWPRLRMTAPSLQRASVYRSSSCSLTSSMSSAISNRFAKTDGIAGARPPAWTSSPRSIRRSCADRQCASFSISRLHLHQPVVNSCDERTTTRQEYSELYITIKGLQARSARISYLSGRSGGSTISPQPRPEPLAPNHGSSH